MPKPSKVSIVRDSYVELYPWAGRPKYHDKFVAVVRSKKGEVSIQPPSDIGELTPDMAEQLAATLVYAAFMAPLMERDRDETEGMIVQRLEALG